MAMHPLSDRRSTILAMSTPTRQALFLDREEAGLSNDTCPICEDEDSFGEPCENCAEYR